MDQTVQVVVRLDASQAEALWLVLYAVASDYQKVVAVIDQHSRYTEEQAQDALHVLLPALRDAVDAHLALTASRE